MSANLWVGIARAAPVYLLTKHFQGPPVCFLSEQREKPDQTGKVGAENLNIWDFTLSDEDMEAISVLDLGHSEIIDHSAAETAEWQNGWKIHD